MGGKDVSSVRLNDASSDQHKVNFGLD